MIATQNISLSYSGKPLFKNVNIKFTAGNLLWHHRRKRNGQIDVPQGAFR